MTDCVYLSKCPIFARFKLQGIANIWIRLYCQGSQQNDCQRKQLRESGSEVPETLLPDGSHMGSLTD